MASSSQFCSTLAAKGARWVRRGLKDRQRPRSERMLSSRCIRSSLPSRETPTYHIIVPEWQAVKSGRGFYPHHGQRIRVHSNTLVDSGNFAFFSAFPLS